MKYGFYFSFLLVCFSHIACDEASASDKEAGNATVQLASGGETSNEALLVALSEQMVDYLSAIPVDSNNIPRTLESGQLSGTKSKSWTSGFFPGLLWQLYDFSKDAELKAAARQWQAFVEKEKYDDTTHDLGC